MAKINEMPPLAFLQERFAYCPATGQLTYRIPVSQRRRVGAVAGFIHRTGYRYVKFAFGGGAIQVATHRIAWALSHHDCPPSHLEIDHIDRNKLNNRLDNLRLVTRAENAKNMPEKRANRAAGGRGVSRLKRGRWRAYKYTDGRYVHLGYFLTEQEAIARVAASERADS